MSNFKNFLLIIALATSSMLAHAADKSGEIPFKLVQGFAIVVRGEIGPMHDLNFLLDTGAVPSVLSQRASSQLGLRGLKGSLTVLDKDTQAEYVDVQGLKLGWVSPDRLPMVVVDLARLEQRLGTRIDAIVGLDLFISQDISIDYKHRTITRGLSGQARHSVAVESFTASGAPYWVLPISLGGAQFRMLLDTGANDLGLFAPRASTQFKLAKNQTVSHQSATGEQTANTLSPMTLLLSDAKFKNQSAIILGEAPGPLREIDGILGPTALGITRIELDWAQQRLLWDSQ